MYMVLAKSITHCEPDNMTFVFVYLNIMYMLSRC